MFMRLCSICATLAFLLGVLVVLYIWPVFQRGKPELRHSKRPLQTLPKPPEIKYKLSPAFC